MHETILIYAGCTAKWAYMHDSIHEMVTFFIRPYPRDHVEHGPKVFGRVSPLL
jgi:hypothetical protein